MSIINFKDDYEIVLRVKSVIGIPEEMIKNEDIISPPNKIKTEKYINDKIKNISSELKDYDINNLKIAYIYHIAYLMSFSMPARLPQRMENISTKTQLQPIDWYKFGQEMLKLCDEMIDSVLEDHGESTTYGTTMIDLSDAVAYPNELV